MCHFPSLLCYAVLFSALQFIIFLHFILYLTLCDHCLYYCRYHYYFTDTDTLLSPHYQSHSTASNSITSGERHATWYSWGIGALTGSVYTFGFVLMCPQVRGPELSFLWFSHFLSYFYFVLFYYLSLFCCVAHYFYHYCFVSLIFYLLLCTHQLSLSLYLSLSRSRPLTLLLLPHTAIHQS